MSRGQTTDILARIAKGERCHANRDGDCYDRRCPQLEDGEPHKSGRHCPLDIDPETGHMWEDSDE